MSTSRTIDKVVPATTKGNLTRLIGTVDMDGNGTNHPLSDVDPFILLDTGVIPKNHMPPFGAHPHRGHSVVTILLGGNISSWDSFGRQHKVMAAPSSYWVDAGSGVFHEEFSVIQDESDASQHMHLFQLWVGVKEEDRSKPARVQYDCNLPRVQVKDTNDEKVVGHAVHYVGGNHPGKIETIHPISVVHIQQTKGTTYQHAIDPTHAGFVVHMKGNPSIGGTTPDKANDVLVLTNNSNGPAYLEIQASGTEDAEYLICTGQPNQEPWYKKLVANGAVIAANKEEAASIAKTAETMSAAGKAEGGSFAPFGK